MLLFVAAMSIPTSEKHAVLAKMATLLLINAHSVSTS